MTVLSPVGRRLAVSLTLCALAVPAFRSQAAVAAPYQAPAASRCLIAQVHITPLQSSGAAGHIGLMFAIHNRSTTTCTLYGYPGAQLLNAKKQNLPTHVHRGPGYLANQRPRLVRLAPGANAYFLFEWVHIPTGNQSCPTAPSIRITPPNDFSSQFVALGPHGGIDACGGNLTATPVEPNRFGF